VTASLPDGPNHPTTADRPTDSPPPETRSRGAEPEKVGPYLADALGDPRWRSCTTTLIAGGKSNLTYLVASEAGEVVLRRPPLGHVLPTAHDMRREARILAALGPTPVPVPQVLAAESSPDLLGQPFYVMSKVDGHIARESLPPGYCDSPQQRWAVGEGLVDVLVDLHRVDYREVGLEGFGKPEGFLERQVRRWVGQWQASKEADLPALDALAADLAASVPASGATGIVHGDYRLDNCMLDPTECGRIAAVLDWELSTVGDPLVDVGLLLVYWTQADDDTTSGSGLPGVTSLPGFPTRAEVLERYAARSGRDVSALPWYTAYGAFKLAVILEGIAMRVRGGSMLGDGFEGVADRVPVLVEMGRSALADGVGGAR
jgi:aminoglycoside phosphotransferase (APT) family kinase protein